MTINETLIEKYFSKQLSEVELVEFKNQYKTDQDFKAEVDFLKNIQYVSEAEDDAQFKSQLGSYESEFKDNQKSKSPRRLKPMIAVAALLLITLGITFLLNKDLNTEQLFNTYFEPSKNVSAPIVRSESNDELLNNAFIAYSAAEYNEAIPLFENAFENTKNSELLFYEGNALLALDKTEDAIAVFKKHLFYTDALRHRTHWYLALAYIKMEELDKANQELKIYIDSGESFKKKEAQLLLKKLE
ncbi:tetratricopeptide repeat protein [Gelidibacter gilvus]|uniref:Tetratricopeptide repeat protein n=1 Tax=Gelidibacter gilvus TaxID=59602 RepID=A0A4Q0X9S6_9FLAO|nr:hypothetical protein [Gelidibacter gilvus]RXJ43788.1 hypothetical protein ESZ48_18775 [Gelidibacter gilvus]